MTHHLDGSSFGDIITLLSQGLQVNHSLGQKKQHVRGRKPMESPAVTQHGAESPPRQERLAQGSKKTSSSVLLQTRGRTSSDTDVMAKQQP